MEWLKKILENATITDGVLDTESLMESVSTEFPKHAVPKETFNDINGQLKTANTTITDLKKSNADNDELQKTIKEHEETISKLATSASAREFDIALELELVKAKARNTKALKAVLDLETIKRKEDGSFECLQEQLKAKIESDTYLFDT